MEGSGGEEQGQCLMQRQKVGPIFPEGADLATAWEDHLFHPLPAPSGDLTHMLSHEEQQQVQTPAGPANYQTTPGMRALV